MPPENTQTTTQSQPLSPSWAEIFQEIGRQLHQRTGLIVIRVLVVVIPIVGVIYLIDFYLDYIKADPSAISPFMKVHGLEVIIAVILLCAALMIISMAILKIEKTVWLDSYFDGVKLTSKESRKIAGRLYWAYCMLQVRLFFRYYIWVIVAIVVAIRLYFYIALSLVAAQVISSDMSLKILAALFIVGGIGSILWVRYLKIKTSYAPFIFLDRYSPEKGSAFWKEFFIELNQLHKASRGRSFQKNVLIELGADVTRSLLGFVKSAIHQGAYPNGVGVVGFFFGGIVAREVGDRLVLFAKITSRYVLYRYAFKQVHGETHCVNEYIYRLK